MELGGFKSAKKQNLPEVSLLWASLVFTFFFGWFQLT